MSDDIQIRVEGRAGRITLTRPKALNALTWDMCLKIEAALDAWAKDDAVALLIIDAEGDKAFCAGGDIAVMYETGKAGDFDYGRRFWADEYRMNAKMFNFPKPVVSLMQGFTMGGGVGVGCHGSHRVVCETSQIAMPETGIGLIPDVGGSLLLSRAPGRLGEYLGVTSDRMGPGDAIHAEFADYFIPRDRWPALIDTLCENGDWEAVDRAAETVPDSPLKQAQGQIDRLFSGETLRDILVDLTHHDGDLRDKAMKAIGRNSPLSMACAVEIIHRVRLRDTIEAALEQEYRFTYRAMEHGDFLEGIRATIIDKDRNPTWRHDAPDGPGVADVAQMLLPLGTQALKL
ncbi:3-hydroxyisobutyryl-CoA hydrolase [Roseibacterium elongatum DSM 19469]|uniref:3-hydroxyisobutyryl-CoA hydrolase n=1 Tax=Roseicyclus elongatus DSM 19469 TaxID=1294273 RepID=W8S8U5_9RHOB|nr:enoyl-CoA hydratase/isomerase family protein [Roseibacterium elongatum]AHM05391.1 3-hydroxyisobutyryl-CoA hydrolase [Roseibacterium elongatum DSM 19469]